MSVVLRCPNCGTTQGRAGECEACSEGDVQYFCTNHDGTWLDGPVCRRCGAKFGDVPRRPGPEPTRPRITTGPAGAPDFGSPHRRRTPEPPPEPDSVPRVPRRPDPDDPPDSAVLPPTPSLSELLEELARTRARRRVPHEMEETPWAGPARPGLGIPLAGCLIRLVGIGVLLLVAFAIFLFVLFGGIFIR